LRHFNLKVPLGELTVPLAGFTGVGRKGMVEGRRRVELGKRGRAVFKVEKKRWRLFVYDGPMAGWSGPVRPNVVGRTQCINVQRVETPTLATGERKGVTRGKWEGRRKGRKRGRIVGSGEGRE